MLVKLIDYGVGNTLSIVRAYAAMDIECRIVRRPAELKGTTPLILGGVGRFDDAIRKLRVSGLQEAITEAAAVRGVPVLGICLGMHLLTEGSEEGDSAGLSLIHATTIRFNFTAHPNAPQHPVPHIGWNKAGNAADAARLPQIMPDSGADDYYFNHSYHLADAAALNVAITRYGYTFPSAIQKGSIFGVQFHPEKSRGQGIELLRRFAEYGASS